MKFKMRYGLLIVSVVCLFQVFCGNIQAMKRDPTISLYLKNKPLADVVEDISQQIQYQIVLDKDCGNPDISGDYNSLPVDKFFAKLLKRQNATILIDYEERVIHLDCLASNEHAGVHQATERIAQNSGENRPDDGKLPTNLSAEELNLLELSRLDPMPEPLPTAKTPQELDEMVDPETGLTLREMEKQMKIKFD